MKRHEKTKVTGKNKLGGTEGVPGCAAGTPLIARFSGAQKYASDEAAQSPSMTNKHPAGSGRRSRPGRRQQKEDK